MWELLYPIHASFCSPHPSPSLSSSTEEVYILYQGKVPNYIKWTALGLPTDRQTGANHLVGGMICIRIFAFSCTPSRNTSQMV